MAVQTLHQLLKSNKLDSMNYSILCGIKGKLVEYKTNNTDVVLLFDADEDNDFFPIFKGITIKNDKLNAEPINKFSQKYENKFGLIWINRNRQSVKSPALAKSTAEVMQIVFPRTKLFGGFRDFKMVLNGNFSLINVNNN